MAWMAAARNDRGWNRGSQRMGKHGEEADHLGGASPGLQAGVSRLLFLQFHPRLLLLPRDTRKVTRLEIRAAESKALGRRTHRRDFCNNHAKAPKESPGLKAGEDVKAALSCSLLLFSLDGVNQFGAMDL